MAKTKKNKVIVKKKEVSRNSKPAIEISKEKFEEVMAKIAAI